MHVQHALTYLPCACSYPTREIAYVLTMHLLTMHVLTMHLLTNVLTVQLSDAGDCTLLEEAVRVASHQDASLPARHVT